VYLIGSGLFKLSMMAHNAIMKFLASTGRAVIGGATLLGQKTMSGLKAAGVAIERGAEALSQSFNKLKENTANVVKWIFNSFKQFGAAVWGKVLLAGSAIKELAGIVGDFFKNTYNTVANAVGKTWDQAKGMAQQAYSKVKDTASNIGKGISSAYDKTRGYLSGFLSEIFERFLSMNNMTGHELISECVKYNNKVIL
jgi:phage-related protein